MVHASRMLVKNGSDIELIW